MILMDEAYHNIVEKLSPKRQGTGLPDILNEVCNLYDLKSVAYFGVNRNRPSVADPYLAVTYSNEWVNHYRQANYVDIDPVVHQGFNSVLPVDWSGFKIRSRRLQTFFGEAQEFGLGRNGLTFPIRGRNGSRALFTITSGEGDKAWQDVSRLLRRDFLLLAYHVHQSVEVEEGLFVTPPKLAPREIECLKWSAVGKTIYEISIILGLSDKTVRYYLDTARTKLDASNNTHAVAKAIDLNLIEL